MTSTMNSNVIVDHFNQLLVQINELTNKLDPEASGREKAFKELNDTHGFAVNQVTDQLGEFLDRPETDDDLKVAVLVAINRFYRDRKSTVDKWVSDNVKVEENAELPAEEETQLRGELDKMSTMARLARQYAVATDESLDKQLAAVPSKKRGARRAGGKRLKKQYTWTVRHMDSDGNLGESEEVKGNNLTALNATLKTDMAELRKAIYEVVPESDFPNPPDSFTFDVETDKGKFRVNAKAVSGTEEDDEEGEDDE